PEYERVFADVFGLSSTEELLNSLLLEYLLDIDTQELADLLNQVCNVRCGETRAIAKANQIQDSALDSFGITVGLDGFKLQIKLLLEQIKLIEDHLKIIEEVMINISNRQSHFLTTITGISDVTACVILGE